MFSRLRQRLSLYPVPSLNDARCFELYWYGKHWDELPTSATSFDWRTTAHNHFPLTFYTMVIERVRSTLITFMGCLLRRRGHGHIRYQVPRDIVKMLARLLWTTREDDVFEWRMGMGW